MSASSRARPEDPVSRPRACSRRRGRASSSRVAIPSGSSRRARSRGRARRRRGRRRGRRSGDDGRCCPRARGPRLPRQQCRSCLRLRLSQVTDEEWDELWRVNVLSYVRAIRAAVPPMREQGAGVIVNVSSTAGKRPSTSMPRCSVTKAAVLSLSRLVARPLRRRNPLQRPSRRARRRRPLAGRGRPRRPAGGADWKPATRCSRRSGPGGRSAAWPNRMRSPRSSSSSAPTARAT